MARPPTTDLHLPHQSLNCIWVKPSFDMVVHVGTQNSFKCGIMYKEKIFVQQKTYA
jgi:hypothetical protein